MTGELRESTVVSRPSSESPGRARDAHVRTPRRERRARGSWVDWIERRRPLRFALVAAVAYATLALSAYWPVWPGDPHATIGCVCGDPVQQSWFLGWTAWALLHGHNPLLTNAMYYPAGLNLISNTSMPLLGLVATPVTALVGAVASFNLLMWLSFPLSAMSSYLVVRKWTHSNLASAVAGLLYGFSPYMVAQGYGHLFLVFVPLPPLIFYALYRIVVELRGRPARWGALLGLLVASQCLISLEVALTTALMASCGLIVLGLTRGRRFDAERRRATLRALGPAVLVAALILAYPVWVGLYGARHVTISSHGGLATPYVADLLGALIPTTYERVAPAVLTRLANTFTFASLTENGSYLGLPLIVLLGYCTLRWRRERLILFSTSMAILAVVLSLGPTLVVATHHTSIPLPWDLLGRIPLLTNALPSRLALYGDFFVSIALALSLAQWIRERQSNARELVEPSRRRRLARASALALVVLCVVTLLPRWPVATATVSTAVPSFFTTGEALQIPDDSVVLTYPFTIDPYDQPLLWQLDADFRWKLLGGFALIPGEFPTPKTTHVTRFLEFWTHDYVGRPPVLDSALVQEFRDYLKKNHVAAVVLEPSAVNARKVLPLFTRALGATVREGGIDLWRTERLSEALQ